MKARIPMEKNNRLLSIHILEILNEHASVNNTMSQKDLMYYLEKYYNEKISRHTCSDYLKELRNNGYIKGNRGVYRVDLFSERELRTLIDGVMYGKHIPEKEAASLMEKLKLLSLNTMKSKARNITYLSGINRTSNNSLYTILDTIDEAIEHNHKIEITQFSIMSDGTHQEWSPKVVDPYFVVSDQSRYYLLCNTNRDNRLSLEPRRIDRISKVAISSEIRTPLCDVAGHNFDLGKYMREHIYMFSGDVGHVEIRIDNHHIGSFIDWYGNDYIILSKDDKYSIIRVYTNYDAVYYWAMQYGGIAEVIYPLNLRNRIRDGIRDMLKKYE